jgi:tape measure domain-containing protein
MANTLEYVLSLQDKLSAKLQKIGITSDTALDKFAKLEQQTQHTGKVMRDMGSSVGALRTKLDLLKSEKEWIPNTHIKALRTYNTEIRKLEGQIKRLDKINGSRMKSWFSQAFDQLPMAGLLTNPLVIGGAAAGMAVKKGIEAELQTTSFEVLLGSTDAAKNLVDNIQAYAAKTPYEKAGLGEAAQTMLGYGIAQEKVMPNMKMLGDIAMGDSNKLQQLSLAYSQIQASGRLTGQDLLQLINSGFNPLGVISEKTGKSIGQLKAEMEKGAISAQMVEDAFKTATSEGGRFYGMSEKMSQTLGGKLSTLMDNVNELFLKLYNIIAPILHPALNALTIALDDIVKGFDWMKKKYDEMSPGLVIIAGLIASLTTAFVLLATAQQLKIFWDGAVVLWNNIQTKSWWQLNAAMLVNPTFWIVAGIVALIAVIAFLIIKIDGWGKTWSNMMVHINLSWQIMKSSFELIWLDLQDKFLSGIELIERGWYKLQALWDKDSARAGLAKIENKQAERAAEMAAAKGKLDELSAARDKMKVWELTVNDTSLSDVTAGIKKKLGLNTPEIPGVVQNGTDGPFAPANWSSTGSANPDTDPTKKTTDTIAQGGTRNTEIHINFRNMVETISFSGGLKENAQNLRRQVEEVMMQVLNQVKATA